ncbi:hypothetical protein [Sphingomonas sp.]|uniref:hypothetical protein n=1 Tax=Sphingomonas sp. TaxID=28214 RepID=UPI00286AB31B|nr:hypothetical protein [Sphingomonas sp.]
MKKMHFRVAALAAVSAAVIAAPALATHSWGGYHWSTRTAGSLSLEVVTSSSSYWESAIATSISDWNNPVVNNAPDVLTLTRTVNNSIDRRKCNPIAGKVLVCNYAYGKRGWLGIASIWLSGGHISQGTTKLNDSYYGAGSSYNTAEWRAIVACQELGHDFGLDHQNETYGPPNLGTCMDYTNDPTGTASGYLYPNTSPNLHDYVELGIIYDHAHANLTLQSAGAGGSAAWHPGPAGDSPAEWGRAVHFDKLGRADTFVEDFGNGRRKLTHVFWALETKAHETR